MAPPGAASLGRDVPSSPSQAQISQIDREHDHAIGQESPLSRREALAAGLAASGALALGADCRPPSRGRGGAVRPVQDGPPELLAPPLQARRGPGQDQGARPALLGVLPRPHPDRRRARSARRSPRRARPACRSSATASSSSPRTTTPTASSSSSARRWASTTSRPTPTPTASTASTSWSRSTASPSASTTTARATATPRSTTIAAAIKDHHPKIGCCIDTGHFLRSKEDPVRAAEVFGKRIYGVHLKDVKDAKTFTVLGEGDLRTADLLKALAALKYRYCLALEYEENPSDPMADIRACLAAVRKAVATLQG